VYLDPRTYQPSRHRAELEAACENIVKDSAELADSGHTRQSRKDRIVQECNNLRQALQDLLTQYEANAGRKEPSEQLDLALVQLGHKCKDLKRNLRRAVVDHISDAFLDTRVPLLLLIEAAARGDVDGESI
jgi:catenin alpha